MLKTPPTADLVRTEGGTHHVMHKGDVIHIVPGLVPWTVLPLAVKIELPKQAPPAQ